MSGVAALDSAGVAAVATARGGDRGGGEGKGKEREGGGAGEHSEREGWVGLQKSDWELREAERGENAN